MRATDAARGYHRVSGPAVMRGWRPGDRVALTGDGGTTLYGTVQRVGYGRASVRLDRSGRIIRLDERRP